MTRHDYVVLGMAAVWLVTNFLGAAFTIRHLRNLRQRLPMTRSQLGLDRLEGRFAIRMIRLCYPVILMLDKVEHGLLSHRRKQEID
jgi:hypothetical protein